MYDSKYYTCEQIDERLLQNYFNDFVKVTGYTGTKEDYHNLIFSITPLSENINKKIDVNISNIGISNFSTFSVENTYVLGNIITYKGKLYKCILAVSTAGAWSESNWEITSIYKILYDFINVFKSDLQTIRNSGTFANRPTATFIGEFYFCTDTNRPIWWNGTEWYYADGTIATSSNVSAEISSISIESYK